MVRIIGYLFTTCLLAQAVAVNPQDPKSEVKKREPTCDFSLHLSSDGAVELTLREEDRVIGKSVDIHCKAVSMIQFRENYPDITKKYRIDRILEGDGCLRLDSGDVADAFEKWKQTFDHRWFWDRNDAGDIEHSVIELSKVLQTGDLKRWLDDQRVGFDKFRQLRPVLDCVLASPGETSGLGPSLDAWITSPGEALASQLDFERTQGVIFAEVKANGFADRSGLRTYDIALKINGKPITDTTFFQKEVFASTKGFTLEILRRGKRESITIPFEK